MGGKPADRKPEQMGAWGQFDPFQAGDAARFQAWGGDEQTYRNLTPEQKQQWMDLTKGDGQGHGAALQPIKDWIAGLHGGGAAAGGSDVPGATPGATGAAAPNGYSQAATPNTSGPWGGQGWTQDPKTGQWTQNTNLDPRLAQSNTTLEHQYADALNHPLSGEQARKEAIDASYNQSTSRLDPQWDKRQEALRTQLLNQGLDPSSEAGMSAMRESNLARNDAYSSAMNAAQLMGDSAGNSLFNNQLAARNSPLQQMGMMKGLTQGGSHPELLSAYIAQKNNELGLAGQGQANLSDAMQGGMSAVNSAVKGLRMGSGWGGAGSGQPIGYDNSGTPYSSNPDDWENPYGGF